MTGTASEFYDDESTEKNFELLTAWLLGRINANCQLHDLSYNGCALLIPKHLNLPSTPVKIAIMSPDNDERVHVVINAEMRWMNEERSASYNKAGFMFLETGPDITIELSELIDHQQQANIKKLKCCVLDI